jgi:hypothetical protein
LGPPFFAPRNRAEIVKTVYFQRLEKFRKPR